MSSTGAEKMNLNNLPSDVVRIIIGMEPEAMESMRVISPSWNRLFLDNIKTRQLSASLPVLRLFDWRISSRFPKGSAELCIQLRQEDVQFLGVDWGIRDRYSLETRIRTVQRAFRYSSSIEDRVALLLSRCSRIEHLKLAMDIFDHELPLKVVRHAMRHLTVGTRTLSGLQSIDQPLANLILDIIRNKNNSLKCLTMKEDEDCNIIMENFGIVQPFLAEASTLISRVYFSFTDTKFQYDRAHWEEIHERLGMRNSKIFFYETYKARNVEIHADN